MQRIIPNIWCSGNADEVAAFYEYAFESVPGGIVIRSVEQYPQEGLLDLQEDLAGETLSITLEISGFRIVLINSGDEIRPTPALNFMLNFDPLMGSDMDKVQSLVWDRLKEDGRVLMELGEYPFSQSYGWVEDRFGVGWQLISTDPEGAARPFVLPSLMFGGAAQNKAAAAQEQWVEAFPDSSVGARAYYPEPTGPAEEGALMFSEFQLAGQWFTAMDSGVEQQESFTPGVSLMFEADGQEELDRVWEALSAVPEAEQCGWLVDQFGVSWQIVPSILGELLTHPGAFEKLMNMKKIEMKDFTTP
ncbi:VOC family protein [uncultured Corynebacterium sp.]|uniref:VOC family protein n=1 Tax=uncultured Corynebacterium sp. TaxID=159447 RepID=UPI0025D164E1|nr:VOC family protein [uncultured Corynebacterium sp.]